MPAPLPLKVCPFCLVDAHTDATSCAYCGSSYERVVPTSMTAGDGMHPRLRTYDGTHHLGADAGVLCVSLDLT